MASVARSLQRHSVESWAPHTRLLVLHSMLLIIEMWLV